MIANDQQHQIQVLPQPQPTGQDPQEVIEGPGIGAGGVRKQSLPDLRLVLPVTGWDRAKGLGGEEAGPVRLVGRWGVEGGMGADIAQHDQAQGMNGVASAAPSARIIAGTRAYAGAGAGASDRARADARTWAITGGSASAGAGGELGRVQPGQGELVRDAPPAEVRAMIVESPGIQDGVEAVIGGLGPALVLQPGHHRQGAVTSPGETVHQGFAPLVQ